MTAEKDHISYVNGRWGTCYFLKNDEYIGKSLLNYGEYSPDETEFILKLASLSCQNGRRALDIGANIGAISQALETSGFLVEAFEPIPEIFSLLQRNIKGPAHNVALGSINGMTTMPALMYDRPNNYGGFAIGTDGYYGNIEVPVHRLDEYDFDNIGLIKIDVEGHEEEVLRGGSDTIKRCKPILYIEDDRPDKSDSLHAFIRSFGYIIKPHRPALYREKNFSGKRENVWPENFGSFNIVCYLPD